MKRTFPSLSPLLLICLLLLSGCSTLGSYARMTDQARLSLSQGRFSDALTVFPEKRAQGKDEVLIRMERGMILQLMGSYDDSSGELQKAAARIKAFEDKAVVSASRTFFQTVSLLWNEQALPYEGEDFEKIFVHAFNGVNYLMKGDLEGARVEIRNTYRRQNELFDKHAKELENARNESGGRSWEDSFQQKDKGRYEELRQKADSVQSVYQNAFAYYLSSLVYELGGEQDEAYIDLKKGIQAAPWSKDMQKDLIRLSRKLNNAEDTEKLQAAYGKLPEGYGKGIDVFVIYEQGVAPVKEELRLPIFLPRGGLTFMALPVYRFVPSPDRGVSVSSDGVSAETSMVCDIDAIASRSLLDAYPVLFAKQVVRSALKGSVTHNLTQDYHAAGAVGGTLFSLITERADLRAWSMLPKQVQVARVFVPEKTRQLHIGGMSANGGTVIDIPDKARHLIVLCRATDAGLFLQTKAYQ